MLFYPYETSEGVVCNPYPVSEQKVTSLLETFKVPATNHSIYIHPNEMIRRLFESPALARKRRVLKRTSSGFGRQSVEHAGHAEDSACGRGGIHSADAAWDWYRCLQYAWFRGQPPCR